MDKKSHLVEFQQLNPIIVSINIIIIIIIIIRALFRTQSEYLQMDTERLTNRALCTKMYIDSEELA